MDVSKAAIDNARQNFLLSQSEKSLAIGPDGFVTCVDAADLC